MTITIDELLQLVDQSLLDPDVTEKEVRSFSAQIRNYGFIAAFVLPGNLPILAEELEGVPTKLGTGIGFPFGANTTSTKLKESEEAIKLGADELDVVINIGALKSENYDLVQEELRKLVKNTSPHNLKAILEVSYLNTAEIREGVKIACNSGVDYVKTGTGFGSRATNLFDIKVISEAIDSDTKIKAAGGIKDIYTLLEMYRYGVRRFGVSRGAQLVEQFKDNLNDSYNFE